jgi:hypothetical protein
VRFVVLGAGAIGGVVGARLHGVPAPVNERLQALAGQMARNQRAPGWLSPEDVLARVD